MSAALTRLKALLPGRRQDEAVAALAADLRELQQQVEALRSHVHALETNADEQRVRQVEDFDSIRASITAVADDLSERIAALHRASEAQRERAR